MEIFGKYFAQCVNLNQIRLGEQCANSVRCVTYLGFFAFHVIIFPSYKETGDLFITRFPMIVPIYSLVECLFCLFGPLLPCCSVEALRGALQVHIKLGMRLRCRHVYSLHKFGKEK